MADSDESTLDLHACIITDCNIFMEGKNIKHNHKNMLNILSDERCAWIDDQLTDALEKANVFFKS